MNNQEKSAVTRFAPSPTGFLHVGGVRTALYAWLLARRSGGKFILRIEDTDKVREVPGSEQHIQDSLRWLGLEWDEGPDKGGQNGPYKQSERLDIYKEWAQKLIESGRAYADPYSKEELDQLREKAKAAKKPFLFRDYRPQNPPAWDGSQPLRFRSEPKDYQWHDEVMGDLSTGPEVIDDFILIKSDGYPTYNFAHIIDDHLMGVSHVIRSQEFLPSTPKFLNLYDALGIIWPKFATMPYVLGPDGKKKLSKRDGAKDILDYREEGFLPEALVSFLATLGWSDGTEQEIFSREELVQKFSIDRVQRSGAKFDEQRLTWINGSLIRDLPLEKLAEYVKDYWPAEAGKAEKDYTDQVLALVQERLKYFAELPELTGFFFKEPEAQDVKNLYLEPQDKQLKKMSMADFKRYLDSSIARLQHSSFRREDIQERLNQLMTELQAKPAQLFPVLRIAVSGQKASPEIFGTLSVLGREETLSRLNKALAQLDSAV